MERGIVPVVVASSRSMDIFENQYFALNRKLALLAGIWPTQSFKERIFRSSIIGSLLLFSVLVQLCPFFTLDFDLRSVAARLEIFIPSISILTIYLSFILQFVTVKKIFNCINKDWQQLKDDVELKIMQRHIHETNIFTLFCVASFIIYTSSLIIPTVLRKIMSTNERVSNNEHFPLVSCVDYFLDRETHYYLLMACQTAFIILGSMVSVVCFSTYFWILQHVCARLSVIKSKIQQPFIDNHHNRNVLVKPIDLTHWIIGIIQHLARTTKYMNLVNTLSERCYLVEMSLSTFTITVDFLCIFQIPDLLKNEENRHNIFQSIFFVTGTLSTVYLNCYMGQKLIDYSMEVYREVCLVPIYGISLKTQKLLLTTLTMSVKPYAISIGKMFVSSHEFFSNVVQMSLSFAMMLHSMDNM